MVLLMGYGKLAKAQANKLYIPYKVPERSVTLQAMKLVINTSANSAKTMLSTFHTRTKRTCVKTQQ